MVLSMPDAEGRPPLCITHAQGCMLITDLLNAQLAVRRRGRHSTQLFPAPPLQGPVSGLSSGPPAAGPGAPPQGAGRHLAGPKPVAR